MSLLKFTWLGIRGRAGNVTITVLSIIVAAALVFTVITLSKGLDEGIKRQADVYDLVVGSEGSAMQLVLSSLLRLDKPLGNIPYHLYENYHDDARVLRAVPIALGDSYGGFPIVGTTEEYFIPFRVGMKERFHFSIGRGFERAGEVVVGAVSAEQLKLQLGSRFYGNHGATESHETHKNMEYTVTGILARTGTADDRALFTMIESVWAVHEDHEEKEITALLVKPQQLGFAPGLKEEFEKTNGVQAAYSVREFRKLLANLDWGKQLVFLLSGISIALAAALVILAIMGANERRRAETSILRALGVRKRTVLRCLLLETLMVSCVGTVGGYIVASGIVFAANTYSTSHFGLSIPQPVTDSTLWIAGALLLLIIGVMSFIPMLYAYAFSRSQYRSLS